MKRLVDRCCQYCLRLGGLGRYGKVYSALKSVDAEVLTDLVAANRILAGQGVLDAYGHVSMRHPGNPQRYLLSCSRSPGNVAAEDIMEFDLDSNPIDQQGRTMFVERPIHGEIYKARSDVNVVVHSHSPAVIPFSITDIPLRPVMHTSSFLWSGVPVWDIRDAAGPTDLLVRTGELGRSLAVTLADKTVALLRGHGNVVVGPDVQRAVVRAVYTEANARAQISALGMGGPIRYIADDEGAIRDKSAQRDIGRIWSFLKSKIDRG